MPKNRIIMVLGVLIALMPLLGFPPFWESFFQVGAGASIVLLSIWSTIDKKLSLKAKAQRRQAHRRAQDRVLQEDYDQEIDTTQTDDVTS
jgi:hypothetical protein